MLSVKGARPEISSQTADKLVSSEVKAAVEALLVGEIVRIPAENPQDAKTIAGKMIDAARARKLHERHAR